MSDGYYYVFDNYYVIKGKKKILTGDIRIAEKSDLISYIVDCQINDLAENMRFIETDMNDQLFILDDNLDLIHFHMNFR